MLLLYGSLRERSFSRLVLEESARLLQTMGAEISVFNPMGLPLVDELAGSQSFSAVKQMRVVGRWMRMLTLANQCSVA